MHRSPSLLRPRQNPTPNRTQGDGQCGLGIEHEWLKKLFAIICGEDAPLDVLQGAAEATG